MSEKVSCSSKVDRAYPTAAFSDSITYYHSRRDREMVMALLCNHVGARTLPVANKMT